MENTIRKTQCSGCDRYFVGTASFDAHRTGNFKTNQRRCMTEEEMCGKGMATEKKTGTAGPQWAIFF